MFRGKLAKRKRQKRNEIKARKAESESSREGKAGGHGFPYLAGRERMAVAMPEATALAVRISCAVNSPAISRIC